jgi:hypothetical protein
MKHFIAVALTIALFTSCVKVNFNEEGSNGGGSHSDDPNETKLITGTIDRSITLRKGVYTLQGYVYVNNNAVLTIEPGTIIKSAESAGGEKGALIIERGSKLIAEGTPNEPIVFTSAKAPGNRAPGDWGGIILLGKAPTNRPTSPAPIIEGGVNRPYGGTDPNDNSGILKYVRIEFSGVAAEPGSEINGLTLGGVGAGTTIEYVQVSYGSDDAYEFFGGTVNCRHLVALGTMDDDFDFDFGYTGNIQFAVSLRDKPADSDAANGIEADNDGSGTSATPYTRPVLSNFTFIGPYDTTGAHSNHNYSNRWRRAVRFVLRNSLLIGHLKAGFSIESDASLEAYKNGESEFKNNIVAVYAEPYKSSNSAILSAADMKAKAESEGCLTLATREEVELTDPFNLTNPNFLPKAGSPALTGGSTAGMGAFFTNTAYRGAFGDNNWLTGWASFSPKTNNY